MKCPRCQTENPDGVKFCTNCGLPLAPVDRGRKGSGAGKVVVSILKAFCYVMLMMGMQYIVYTAFASYSMLSSIEGGYLYDYESMLQRILTILLDNITMLTLISNLLTILFLSLFFLLRRKNPLDEVMLRPVKNSAGGMRWDVLFMCALYGTALNIFISLTLSYLPIPPELINAVDEQYANLFGKVNPIIEILNTAVITGIVEEVIFRGLSFSRLRKGMPRIWAVVVSGLIFGIFHGALVAVLYATCLGIVFALLADRYQSILPTIICHIFFNFTSFWLNTESGFILLALYFAAIAVLVVGSYFLFTTKVVKPEETQQ